MEFETEHTPPLTTETRPKASELIAPAEARQSFRAGLNSLLRTFSPSERLFLYILSIVLGVSAFILLANVNTLVSTEVPTRGGSLTEGGAGTPRFINPLLAASDPDQDLTTLIYSGLLRAVRGGDYTPDLAESYEISEDGTTYTFHLRHNLTFHDGEPLTAADVLFTIALAQNQNAKSPRRADWEGVTASSPDEYTVVFTLPHAYAPFPENAAIGILPKHLWESVPAEEFPFSSLNTHPVGSGPYKVRDVLFDATGAPTEYRLFAFDDFALGSPHIGSIIYRMYANEEALLHAYENGDIESFVASTPKNLPRDLQESEDLQRMSLARVFGIFLNQNHAPSLTSFSVRSALDAAIHKEDIIQKVLGGYGTALEGPVPPGLLPAQAGLPPLSEGTVASTTTDAVVVDRIKNAKSILSRGGWKFSAAATSTPVERAGSTGQVSGMGTWTKDKTTLSLTLATVDTEELVATAHAVADAWNAVGIPTSVQVYPLQEFNSTILRPRSYDAVLFGEVVGRSLDLFAFWHSSQRNDPGLNLSLYTSTAADKSLALARSESNLEKRQEFLRSFLNTLDKDMPAVFLYSPQLVYVVPSRLQGVEIGTLTSPADRFVSIHSWYRDTERVWNIFSQ